MVTFQIDFQDGMNPFLITVDFQPGDDWRKEDWVSVWINPSNKYCGQMELAALPQEIQDELLQYHENREAYLYG